MNLVVGICGSIASYRAVDFVKGLTAQGHTVKCILTRAGKEFVSAKALEVVSGNPVLNDDPFDAHHPAVDHIAVARWADTLIVYGATANALAKFAQATGEDFLALQLLAFTQKVFIVPAMNPAMWNHPGVARNVSLLKEYGYTFIGPIHGMVTCGEEGLGHIASDGEIYGMLRKASNGKKILISVGPMQTAIDPVRFIQNRSSGKMGLAIAEAYDQAGAEVTVLLGPVSPEMRARFAKVTTNARLVDFQSADEYGQRLTDLFAGCDTFFSAAAVLDFEVVAHEKKLERKQIAVKPELALALRSVPDYVAQMNNAKKAHQRVVAFAAEGGTESEIIERAIEKLRHKKADAIVANPLWDGVGPEAEENVVWLIFADGTQQKIDRAPKAEIAKALFRALTNRGF